jgi:hypothetical protein
MQLENEKAPRPALAPDQLGYGDLRASRGPANPTNRRLEVLVEANDAMAYGAGGKVGGAGIFVRAHCGHAQDRSVVSPDRRTSRCIKQLTS